MQTTHKYPQKKEEALLPQKKKETHSVYLFFLLWEQRESNPRPSACKADALNQLSYAPETGLQIYGHFLVLQIFPQFLSQISLFLLFCDLNTGNVVEFAVRNHAAVTVECGSEFH